MKTVIRGLMILAASASEIGLTIGLIVLVFGGAVALQVWSRRRRRRGEEAATSNAEGADAIVFPPNA